MEPDPSVTYLTCVQLNLAEIIRAQVQERDYRWSDISAGIDLIYDTQIITDDRGSLPEDPKWKTKVSISLLLGARTLIAQV
jgi:hypothetical protein